MSENESAGLVKRITSHAIGTVFVDVLPSGEVKIAAMYYTKRGRTTLRVPMGKSLKTGGEKLTDTQVREVLQEAAENPAEFSYELLFNNRFVYYDVVPDDTNPDQALHFKGFFAARVTAGLLRNHRMVEHEGSPDEETLDRLVRYEARELVDRMAVRGVTIRCHALAVLATIVQLVGKYPAVARRYGDIAENAAVRVAITTPYRDQVAEYVKALQG